MKKQSHNIHPYYSSWQKRAFDFSMSVIIVLAATPLLCLIIIVIYITSGSPVIFTQKRLGKDKKIFILYKFRTMHSDAEKVRKKLQNLNEAPLPMFKIKNDPRFTLFGKTLSNFGLDELPQLFNILKNEMSLVGPRPLPLNEANNLPAKWDIRYEVKPGVFSYWTLSHKRYESLATWLALDRKQLKFGSTIEDLLIITKTMINLLLVEVKTQLISKK